MESQKYLLIDSGTGLKLEKFGEYTLIRPDPQALWETRIPLKEWHKLTDVEFAKDEKSDDKGAWKTRKNIPEKWIVDFGVVKMFARLTPFKHTGIFPEQLDNWVWLKEKMDKEIKGGRDPQSIKMLNLFGYSGGATALGLLQGIQVTHVDASKSAIKWAEQNAELNAVLDKPVRWILEDVVSFVKKEVRRGNVYDIIVMDPPSFGRGAKGEIWKIEEAFLPLMEIIKKILSDKPISIIINGYAAGYSSHAYAQNLNDVVQKFGGMIEHKELLIPEQKTERVLPAGIVARWSK